MTIELPSKYLSLEGLNYLALSCKVVKEALNILNTLSFPLAPFLRPLAAFLIHRCHLHRRKSSFDRRCGRALGWKDKLCS